MTLLAGLAGLAACNGQRVESAAEPGFAPAQDPIALFAASSTPGAEGTVTIPETGQAVRVRLVRAYAAASGRECREVSLGGSRTRLLCRANGGWIEARPLLRDAAARP